VPAKMAGTPAHAVVVIGDNVWSAAGLQEV
jgi:hypothetical protein